MILYSLLSDRFKSRRVDCITFCTDRNATESLCSRHDKIAGPLHEARARRYFLFSISTEAMLLVILYKEYTSKPCLRK